MLKEIAKITLLSFLLAFATVGASYACDQCTELQKIETNTRNNTSYLEKILNTLTNAFFGKVIGLGDYMAAFVAMPSAESEAYETSRYMLADLQNHYMGQDDGTTLSKNYERYLKNVFVDADTTEFPFGFADSGTLFNNPGNSYDYTPRQQALVQNVIANISGTTSSILQRPTDKWQTATTDYTINSNYIKYNAWFATLTSIQSLSANNLAYIAGERRGIDMSAPLSGLDQNSISSNGLIKYIKHHMVGNENWWENLSIEAFSSAIKDGVVLTGGIFVELIKIHEVLERILAAQSAQITLQLLGTNMQTQTLIKNITEPS